MLPGHPLACHIGDFLADLANANKPRNTIRAYRGDLTGFAAHHDGEIGALTAALVRAFLAEIAGQRPRSLDSPGRRWLTFDGGTLKWLGHGGNSSDRRQRRS